MAVCEFEPSDLTYTYKLGEPDRLTRGSSASAAMPQLISRQTSARIVRSHVAKTAAHRRWSSDRSQRSPNVTQARQRRLAHSSSLFRMSCIRYRALLPREKFRGEPVLTYTTTYRRVVAILCWYFRTQATTSISTFGGVPMYVGHEKEELSEKAFEWSDVGRRAYCGCPLL